MRLLSEVRERLRSLVFRSAEERELEEELRFHIERETERLVQEERLSPEEARRRALVAFGGVERTKDEVRDERGTRWLEEMAGDFRYASRQFVRSPMFAAVAVLTLALGIGANSAIFSAVSAVLLEPLEYHDPDRLVFVYSEVPAWGPQPFGLSVSEYRELQDLARSFSEVGAWRSRAVNLSGTEDPLRVTAASASAELFSTLGVPPRLGRTFTTGEDTEGTEPVVVLSSRLWRSAFGGDRSVLGRRIEVDGRVRTVIGVMPEGFDLAEAAVDVWVPAEIPVSPPARSSHPWNVVARLAPGVTPEEATREVEALLARWGELKPSYHTPNDSTHPLGMQDLRDHLVGDVRPALLLLLGAVGFVLLIACANVANLLLARAEGRQREIAVRAGLGASRARLVRQFLTESMMLAAVGGGAGLILGQWGLHALLGSTPGSVPRADSIGLDPRVLLFTIALTALTGLLFGLAPLSHLEAGRVAGALKAGGQRTTAGGRRLRGLLVASQVALAVVLVIGSALLLRSLHSLTSVDPGFEPRGILAFELSLPPASYPEASDRAAFLDRLTGRLENIPGVDDAAAMSGLPPIQAGNESEVAFEGVPEAADRPNQSVDYLQMVTSGYFETMGIRIVAGRPFNQGDDVGATPVAIVNEALALRFFPGQSPLGRRVRLPWGDMPWLRIVGVAADVKQGGLSQATGPELYFHYPQAGTAAFAPMGMHVVMRSSTLPPLSLAEEARLAVRTLDPSLPVARLQTLDAAVAGSISRPRFLALLLGIFAGVGLAVAAVGTYGVLSYSVAKRGREIGIRMAVGAGAHNVLRMVLREGLATAGAGLLVGLFGALALTRLLSSLLFGISSTDAITYAAALALLTVVAFAACWIPARRATRVDPNVALRSE